MFAVCTRLARLVTPMLVAPMLVAGLAGSLAAQSSPSDEIKVVVGIPDSFRSIRHQSLSGGRDVAARVMLLETVEGQVLRIALNPTTLNPGSLYSVLQSVRLLNEGGHLRPNRSLVIPVLPLSPAVRRRANAVAPLLAEVRRAQPRTEADGQVGRWTWFGSLDELFSG